MVRYFIQLSYKGTAFCGWQSQSSGRTVQQVMDEALSVLCRGKICTTGSGRTDAGVHASFFIAHFDTENDDLDGKKNVVYRLNGILPDDVAVQKIVRVRNDAHARFSALSRTYEYTITRVKDPFLLDYSHYYHAGLDVPAMEEACRILKRHDDFTSFSRLHSGNKTTLCRIDHAAWEDQGTKLVFIITADRFLRNMVRAIVGTMLMVGRGRLDPAGFEQIILMKDRGKAGPSAPACGLCLTGITYPDDIFPQP